MDRARPIFDAAVLAKLEISYRLRLLEDPTDMNARVSLAWCLFLQAAHQAGQECLLSDFLEGAGDDRTVNLPVETMHHRDANRILRDCLQQAITVSQLSSNEEDLSDIVKIQQLITLSGGEQAIAESEREAAHILAEITREVMREPHPPRGRACQMSLRPQEN